MKDEGAGKNGKWMATNCASEHYTKDAEGYECECAAEGIHTIPSECTPSSSSHPVEWMKPDNDEVKDGSMVLKASYTRTQEKQYEGNYLNRFVGSEINTADYFKYGYFEIRAKVNLKTGTMSAFWLCGNRNDNIEYEIDIFECFGKYPGLFKQTALAHPYENGSGSKSGSTYNFAREVKDDLAEPNTWLNATKLSSKFKTAELRKWYQESALGSPYQPNKENQLGTSSYFHVENMTDWHTYGLDWREDSITWYIDGIATMRLEIPEGGLKVKDSQQKERTYKFDQPMRLILGLAVDSSDTTPWSKVEDAAYDSVNSGVSMEIDYVRVYQDSKGEVYKNYERTK